MDIVPESLHEVVYNDNTGTRTYFGNLRTVAENHDRYVTGHNWLVDLLIRHDDERRAECAFGWYAIRCIMNDFGELVCGEYALVVHEVNDNLLLWEFAVVIDGKFNICVGDW